MLGSRREDARRGLFASFTASFPARPTVEPGLVGLPIGVYLLAVTDPMVMKRAVAGAVAVCVVIMLFGVRLREWPPIVVQLVVGVLAGVVLGATYIALVAMIFFFALPVSGAQSRANAVFWGIVLSFVLIATHMGLGNTTTDALWRAALLGIFYLAGRYRRGDVVVSPDRGARVPACRPVAAARTRGGRAGGVTRSA